MAKGPLTARYAEFVPVFADQKRTAAQKAGLRYEAAVLKRLDLLYEKVEKGPWIYYSTGGRGHICQPDGLVWLRPDLICVVEVKLTWVKGAREKLLKFYGPIVGALHPRVDLCFLQAYKNPKKGCHKRTVSLYELETMQPGSYKESHALL
jgi:hypothetical protein